MSGRVALDLSCLEVHPETGVERYARRLAETLPRVADDLEFTLVVRSDGPSPVIHPGARLLTVHSRLPRAVWREAALPGELMRRGIPLLHAPVAAIPLRSKLTRVATIHDVPPAGGPDGEGYLSRNRLRMLHAAGAADAIVVPSRATRDALLEIVPGVSDRVHVIPHGVDPDFRPEGVPLDRRRYGIPEGPYLLWVGTIRRRKDPMVLIRAFVRLMQKEERDLRLIMCGDLRVDHEELYEPLVAAGLEERLILPGYVYREDLPDLYREAEALVVPSRLEGFGMCALEAMACARPLVVSRDPALLELTGDAALSFEIGEEEDLTAVLERLLDDEDLRRRLGERGRERAAACSWEASARAHAELYRSLL